MVEDLLRDIGLTEKEAIGYLTLLRHGTRSSSFIAKKAKLTRGTAYFVLHSLLEKGLVAKSVQNRVQSFTALEPEQLIAYVQRQQAGLLKKEEQLKASIGEFTKLVNPLTTKPRIEFFEGVEGARTALEDTLTATDKTLLAFIAITDLIETIGGDYLAAYSERRLAEGYSIHVLRTLEQDKEAVAKNIYKSRYWGGDRRRRDVRYVSDDLAFPLTMYIYDNKICVIPSREEGFAFIIESRDFTAMLKKLFELLWASAGPYVEPRDVGSDG